MPADFPVHDLGDISHISCASNIFQLFSAKPYGASFQSTCRLTVTRFGKLLYFTVSALGLSMRRLAHCRFGTM